MNMFLDFWKHSFLKNKKKLNAFITKFILLRSIWCTLWGSSCGSNQQSANFQAHDPGGLHVDWATTHQTPHPSESMLRNARKPTWIMDVRELRKVRINFSTWKETAWLTASFVFVTLFWGFPHKLQILGLMTGQ